MNPPEQSCNNVVEDNLDVRFPFFLPNEALIFEQQDQGDTITLEADEVKENEKRRLT